MSSLSTIELYSKILKDNQIITVRKDSLDTTDYFASIVTMDPNNPTSVPLEDYVGEPSEYFDYNYDADGKMTVIGFRSKEMQRKFISDSEDPYIETCATSISTIRYGDLYKDSGKTLWNHINDPISRPIIFSNVLKVENRGLAKCTFLNITLPKCLEIGKYGCVYSKIKYMNCPKVELISNLAFYRSNLREINLEKYDLSGNMTYGYYGIFCECSNLKTIYIKNIPENGDYFRYQVVEAASPTLDPNSFCWYWPATFYGKEDGNIFQIRIDNGGSGSGSGSY